MNVITINTYAGSLLLGAQAAGLPVRCSLEDTSFGVKWQRANFPNLRIYDHVDDWPDFTSLPNTIVIAHPPCSAFSGQNNLKRHAARQGVEAGPFGCTVRVLQYAMEREAPAIAIESVPAALEGARHLHDEWASKFGYNVYRILQDARTFGVPQKRKRFWAVFIHNEHDQELNIEHTPVERTVADIWAPAVADGTSMEGLAEEKRRLQALTREYLLKTDHDWLWKSRHSPNRVGRLPSVLKRREVYWAVDTPNIDLHRRFFRGFESRGIRFLDPTQPAPTLLSDSWWHCLGKNLTCDHYKLIMGFPRDYLLPTNRSLRGLLSKGVCPPVATWILHTLQNHLEGVRSKGDLNYGLLPGQTLDISPPFQGVLDE